MLIDNVKLMGSSLGSNIIDKLTKATIGGSHTDVTELELDIIDPGWSLLSSGALSLNQSVQAQGYNLRISNLETNSSGDTEVTTIKARPTIVRLMKDRQGPFVMKNVSPTEYYNHVCDAVGAPHVFQGCARRPSISRDVPDRGKQELKIPKNDYTTCQRLAREVGFYFFESNNVCYFAQPSWIIAHPSGVVNVNYSKSSSGNTTDIPNCTWSEDNPEIQVQTKIRVSGINDVHCGMRMHLTGVPVFNNDYLVSEWELDLMDPKQEVSITGVTPIDPTPQSQG